MQKVLLGILKKDGVLITETGKVALTRLTREEVKRLGKRPLEVGPEQEERLFLVSGDLFRKTLYGASLMEEVSPVSGALINALIKKGIISQDDLLKNIPKPPQEPSPTQRLCALVIGHKKMSPGAINDTSGMTEFDFNDHLSVMIEKRVKHTQVQRVYRRTLKELPDDINSLGPDFVVSLHCNAFNKKASGTEVLYYHRSESGRRLAQTLLKRLVSQLKLPNRGVKPKTAEDRGGYLLCYTKAPAVISEPFFIDNDADLAVAQSDLEGLAMAYASAIDEMASMI